MRPEKAEGYRVNGSEGTRQNDPVTSEERVLIQY